MAKEPTVRVSLQCLLCGLETRETALRQGELTRLRLREALAPSPSSLQPVWDAGLRPFCPRCGGRLLLQIVPTPILHTPEVARGRRVQRLEPEPAL